jgi:hypothetical protein
MSSRHWNVPVEVLMAVGYVETHWEQRDGEPSLDRGYGVMHLVDGPEGTLERAATLTGLNKEALQKTAYANIEGGAAILHDISHELSLETPDLKNLPAWYEAVAAYSGSAEPVVRDGYAREVFRVMREGVSRKISTGEVVRLEATTVEVPENASVAPASDDYPPALWVPAHANNYTVGRPYGPVNFIIIHDTEGSYNAAINWFQNPSSGVSAHYVIRSSDGQITQMVREANTAYQAGNWDYNVRALGIEHEGYASQPGWYTEPMYQASAALARNMADHWGIKKDRAHIIGHYQVPNQSHTDPGPYWDWPHYMSLVRQDALRASLVDNTDAGFEAVPTPIDPQHYWYTYPGGYNGSNAYTTSSVTNPSSSINSGTWTTRLPASGYYDVYAFIPWVDNNTPDTANARYKVYASDGVRTIAVSQRAITDVGSGSWAHIGKFQFSSTSDARIGLDDYTGETGRNVWFDAVMWIPTTGGSPIPTDTPAAATATRTPTRAPTRTFTRVATRTPTGVPPSRTPTYAPTAPPTDTPISYPSWTPGPCGMRFVDLPETYWAYSYIGYLFCNSVISGYADGTFRPGGSTTRAQLTKMVTLGMGWPLYNPVVPDFSDVPFDSPYYQYIETAYVHGIISGYSDGTFRPGNDVTRAQVAKMLVLAKAWTLYFPAYPDFVDVPPDDWAYGYIESAFTHGIISGYADGTFRPGSPVNRGQFSKMLTLTMQSPRK